MTQEEIVASLRTIAGAFTGVTMGHRLAADDHGPSRSLVVSLVGPSGEIEDVGDLLLLLADAVAQIPVGAHGN